MGMLIHNRHSSVMVTKAGDVNLQPTPTVEEVVVEENKSKEYSKTDINRMSTAELQTLAESEGIENALETSGSQLKKILAKHFGL